MVSIDDLTIEQINHAMPSVAKAMSDDELIKEHLTLALNTTGNPMILYSEEPDSSYQKRVTICHHLADERKRRGI